MGCGVIDFAQNNPSELIDVMEEHLRCASIFRFDRFFILNWQADINFIKKYPACDVFIFYSIFYAALSVCLLVGGEAGNLDLV